jgi:mRNA interferase YafQ
MLKVDYTPSFKKDYKRLARKHFPMEQLDDILRLIAENSSNSLSVLKRRHNMHRLTGNWHGANECHVANIGNWLLVWEVEGDRANILRTGSHDEIFR